MELSDSASVIMYMLAVTMVLIIGMTLAVFAYDGMSIVKKWDNICMLEVGKEYAKYGFTYYVPVELEPGEYVTAQKYMAFIRPNYNSEVDPPVGSQQYGAGYFVEYSWADPGEVNLVSSSPAGVVEYPDGVPAGYYPPVPVGAPSLAYLWRGGSAYVSMADMLYLGSAVPVRVELDGNVSYSLLPTKNIVFIKFFPSDRFGVASMERVGVVQFGNAPGREYWGVLSDTSGVNGGLWGWSPGAGVVSWWGAGDPVVVYDSDPFS